MPLVRTCYEPLRNIYIAASGHTRTNDIGRGRVARQVDSLWLASYGSEGIPDVASGARSVPHHAGRHGVLAVEDTALGSRAGTVHAARRGSDDGRGDR